LDELLGVVRENGIEIPGTAGPAGLLSRYAFSTRYPGTAKAVTEEQHQEALAVAETVVRWAEESILGEGGKRA
jgi:HEPN domain-containing protein